MEPEQLLIVLCNFPHLAAASEAATVLVTERLAACVNIINGVSSVYRWEGKVEVAIEVTCLIKTTAARHPALCARLQALHPYQVPEIVALPAAAVNDAYLSWVRAETAP